MTDAELALWISLLSLVVAVTSLIWQVVSWILHRARIKVHLYWGALGADGQHVVMTERHRDLAKALSEVDETQYPLPVVVVLVRNRGRAAMSIQDVGVRFPSGHTYRNRELVASWVITKSPLEPGSHCFVPLPLDEVVQSWLASSPSDNSTRFRGVAVLGSGATKRSG
jgi:hypothetical protein